MTTSIERTWTAVCAAEVVPEYSGVAALLDGVQVAIFRLPGDRWYALSNWDPCSGAAVLSRGIVGDADGVPVVASPVYKERFALDSGQCLDAADVSVPVYEVRVREGVVEVESP
ncbi:nitrite reductase (NAD(P)H) small subunit [Amycolatopsis mediterranei S699]|uniref:Nitrite reductase (NAD(P)H) small subunit n=3 Tax=Amycolatopsis mediterranei TaxID=33910 RepID=A0A0H3CXZ1_AMYMU|nr:nitrite reductase small subunit NirD [Amycolatopsis mediterranei]AAK77363.1 nitrite reductase small subunit [Amycolatopsis mediterranei U32]ADJ42940.1 nitrite reductase (NAD(P)H) small subunit [Amycolatopsis mediterranei U32]AEK39635.1 nitrite reductase (NAD(P)H) small subunit [Amycolatopsis mediterranei S699]AFO74654.1 nitrite reductase (NAD(P)H) small subunit [Amycolatopsis mediterranei S699]AGT81783.1 nitrite reductase (NAD(P)H) small subunit [Amycolatopsis mediterranei RB]